MAEITLIIPVYKVEEFINRCVDSVIAQTYKDFDVVLVDDGSPDNCGSICESYASKDSRIHVIHQKNGGLSAARNTGIEWSLKHSDSRWLSFIDSDDWVHPQYLEALHSAVSTLKTDLSICGYYRTSGEELPEIKEYTFRMYDVRAFYLEEIVSATVSWGKLIKKSCFENLRFPEGKIHEDEFTSYRILFQYRQVAVVDQNLYAYYQNPNGIIRRNWSPARLDHLEALEQQISYFKGKGMLDVARERFFSLLHNNLRDQEYIDESETLREDDKRKLTKKLKQQLRRVICKYHKYNWVPFGKNDWHKALYTNAFIEIRIARAIWGRIKAVLKKNTITHYFGKRVKSIWSYRQLVCSVLKYKLMGVCKKTILINSPQYRNLGDQAIALAELECLDKLGITCCDYPMTYIAPERFASVTSRRKVILFQGGGNLGSLWPREENRFRETVKAYKKNPIIVFPQTLYFDLSSKEGTKTFAESKAVYESHPNLLIFVRERKSLTFMKEHMPRVHVEIAPDMVMALEWENPHLQREGAIICVRGDRERTLLQSDYEELNHIVREYYQKLMITDTVSPGDMPVEERKSVVKEKLSEFSSVSLVVTDRLHGMIFAAITETPCIVLDSLSPKIRGCYEWISDLDYIRFAESIDDVSLIIEELKTVKPKYNRGKIEEAMKPLYEALRNGSK